MDSAYGFWAEEEIERLRNDVKEVQALKQLLIEERVAHAETKEKLNKLRENLGLNKNDGLAFPETD